MSRKRKSLTLADAAGQTLPPKRERTARINKFLAELRQVPNIERAAAKAGLPRRTLYFLRDRDSKLRERWERALAISIERLEELAFKRAQHSDSQLLSWLLRCHKPDPYDPAQKHELKGAVAGVIIMPPKQGAE